MIYIRICNIHADTTFKVLSVLLSCYKVLRVIAELQQPACTKMVTRLPQGLLQPCYQVENEPIPGFRQPCCKAWLLQCYNNQILPGNCRLVTRLSEACCHNQ